MKQLTFVTGPVGSRKTHKLRELLSTVEPTKIAYLSAKNWYKELTTKNYESIEFIVFDEISQLQFNKMFNIYKPSVNSFIEFVVESTRSFQVAKRGEPIKTIKIHKDLKFILVGQFDASKLTEWLLSSRFEIIEMDGNPKPKNLEALMLKPLKSLTSSL